MADLLVQSRTLASERRIRAGAWNRKNGFHSEGRQVSRRGRVCKENLPRRRKHERVSGRRVLVLLQVWPNLKWERRLGEKEHAHKMKERNK